MVELRRRSPRVQVKGWHGRCRVVGAGAAEWTECELANISLIGAGLDLWTDCPTDITGSQLVMELVPPTGESVAVRLSGRVSRTSVESAFHVRVGIEFTDLSEVELTILTVMAQSQGALVA
jgi:hypothetical protein